MSSSDDFRAGIALGSNLGDSLSHLRRAAKALHQLSTSPELIRGSHIYRTSPVDCPPGSLPFLNAVVEIEWKGEVEALWAELQQLEAAAGRQRPHPFHAPRPLDLDLLYVGSQVIPSGGPICLPHPRLKNRRFVLAPLADFSPERVLPNETATIQQLLAELSVIPLIEKIEDPIFT